MKKQDKSWDYGKNKVYIGHQVSDDLIYIGGAYYQSSAQIHLTVDEAKWLKKHLDKALARVKGKRKKETKP